MNISAELIDRVVRDVLQALQYRADVAVASSAGTSSVPEMQTPAAITGGISDTAVSRLDLTALAVVTEAELSAVNAHAVVLIGARTIVTPSAQDVIRRQRLRVTRQSGQSTGQTQPAWTIIAQNALPTSGRGNAALSGLPNGWSYRLGATLSENISECVRRLSRAEISGALLTTSTPHRAVCLAKRDRSVRAAALTSAVELPAIHSETAANLYIVDDRQLSRFGLVGYARAISRLSTSTQPQDWPE
jgi:hypothetical protein